MLLSIYTCDYDCCSRYLATAATKLLSMCSVIVCRSFRLASSTWYAVDSVGCCWANHDDEQMSGIGHICTHTHNTSIRLDPHVHLRLRGVRNAVPTKVGIHSARRTKGHNNNQRMSDEMNASASAMVGGGVSCTS